MKELTTVAISPPTIPPSKPSNRPMTPSLSWSRRDRVRSARILRQRRRGAQAAPCAALQQRPAGAAAPAYLPPACYIIMTTLKKKRTGRVIMRQVRTLGLLGTGVIGGGWAARALHFGIDVVAADLKPEMEDWLRGAVANAEGALSRLTLAPLPPKGKLSFTTDLHAMARQADFIQENIPEQLELKQRVLAGFCRHAPADVVIASSTSGLMPSDLQRDMQAP